LSHWSAEDLADDAGLGSLSLSGEVVRAIITQQQAWLKSPIGLDAFATFLEAQLLASERVVSCVGGSRVCLSIT
jgi:hypothetical protein